MNSRTTSERTALRVVTAIFFMWGFITVLNDVLIPHLKALFTLNYTQAMLVQFTFFGAYFVMSVPSGKVVSHYGYRVGIIAGLIVAGLGALLFLPAAMLPSYPLFLLAFFVLASGITLLQVAANPYVSLLGPPHLASSRLNLAQALNSLGTTLAPKVGGLLILSGASLGALELAQMPAAQQLAYKLAQAQMVQLPYLGIALVLFALAALVWLFHLPSLPAVEGGADDARHRYADALAQRRVWLGMLAIFLYVGAEVSIGSFMINYLALPQIGDMPESRAAGFVSLYWGGAMVGRFVGAALLTRLDPRRVLALSAAAAGVLVLVTMFTHGQVALWSVVAIGLFNSVMFPNIFTLGIDRFGALTGKVSSLLVLAIVGGAVVPVAQGALADGIGVQASFVLPLLCYMYIVGYGLRGSRVA